jgi:ATP-dependent RNA helicase SUPV3L1/SUV3
MPPLPPPDAAVLDRPDPLLAGAAARAGFRPLGEQMLRVDLVERLARAAHDARQGRRPFAPDPSLSTSLGLRPPAVARLMRQLGFARSEDREGAVAWTWRGRRDPAPRPAPSAPRAGNAFGSLAALFPDRRATHG